MMPTIIMVVAHQQKEGYFIEASFYIVYLHFVLGVLSAAATSL